MAHTLIRRVRERFHPLSYARKSPLGRLVIRLVDRPAWLSVPDVTFKVRGRLLTHNLAYALFGSHETNAEALARACMRQLKLRSFWDVGANIGYYAWLMKSINPDLEILLIEPLPENAALIRATLTRCRFPNATLVVAGASDSTGHGTLHADTLGGATSSLENRDQTFEEFHYGVTAGTLQIPLITIDELREHRGPVEFMKIDVEGHEEFALRGARRTISADEPLLFIECNHPHHACLDMLVSQGYRLVDADHLSLSCSDHNSNYFCFPRRFADSVEGLLESACQEMSPP